MAFRRMKRNEKCETPTQVISVGFSGIQREHNGEMVLANLYGVADRRRGNKWYAHDEIETTNPHVFWSWVRGRTSPRTSTWVYCLGWHQCAIIGGLWEQLEEGRFSLGLPARDMIMPDGKVKSVKAWHGFFCIESRPFVVFAISPKGTAKCTEVANYLDLSEQELCDTVGNGFTVERPIDRDVSAHWNHAYYMATGTHTLMTRMIDAWNANGRGNWQPTAGRLALSNWRHEFMPEHGIQWDTEVEFREYHRESLYGGEVRSYRTGTVEGPIYHVDCRSLYAHIMRMGLFPWRIASQSTADIHTDKPGPNRIDSSIATVIVNAGGNTPQRREDGTIAYPTGRILTTLAGPELAECDRAGMILEWIQWHEFDMAPLFQRFAEYWLAIRQQARDTKDIVNERMSKMLMNSLSGKLAGRSATWVADDRFPAVKRWGYWLSPCPVSGKWTQWRAIAGIPQRQVERTEKEDTYPACTAFITAAGREYMRTVRGLLPEGSVICQQTDSWLLTQAGFDALRDTLYWGADTPGCFRLLDTFASVEMFGPNHYIAGKKVCMAGLPLGSERIGPGTWKAELVENTVDYLRREGNDSTARIREHEFKIGDGRTQEYGIDGVAWD